MRVKERSRNTRRIVGRHEADDFTWAVDHIVEALVVGPVIDGAELIALVDCLSAWRGTGRGDAWRLNSPKRTFICSNDKGALRGTFFVDLPHGGLPGLVKELKRLAVAACFGGYKAGFHVRHNTSGIVPRRQDSVTARSEVDRVNRTRRFGVRVFGAQAPMAGVGGVADDRKATSLPARQCTGGQERRLRGKRKLGWGWAHRPTAAGRGKWSKSP